MAKLPKKIKVAAFDIVVEPLQPNQPDTNAIWGDFSSTHQRIRIDTAPSSLKQLHVFFHEVLHSIWWAYGVDDEDKEERTVGSLATGLTQALRDNPQVVKYINEVLSEK